MMMHQVPSHIVQKVTDYAHRKAEFYFRDYLEEFMMCTITENEAFQYYRNEFYEAIFNVLDGNDMNFEVSCPAPTLSLAGLAIGLKRRGYANNSFTLTPLHLKVTVNGLEFSFRVRNDGKFIEVGDFIKFKVRSWNESYLDFLDVLQQQSMFENASDHFEKIRIAYNQEYICDEIMRTTAYKTVGKILDGEPYHFDVIGVHNGHVSFTIYTRLGKIKINSPFEALEEALTRAVDELREVEADYDI